ncbi:MAG: helix-turn-helix transcriptional regulator [Planctomycetes bacterium]|nr:helix-turn-helix transcriptional regulator [Planctomycetota bacterium]
MPKRQSRTSRLTAEEVARDEAIRAKYQNKPTLESLSASGDYLPPLKQQHYFELLHALRRLKELRELHGLSLAEVSKRSGMDRSAISKLENGVFTNPTYATLENYAQAVGANLRFVIEEAGNKPSVTR